MLSQEYNKTIYHFSDHLPGITDNRSYEVKNRMAYKMAWYHLITGADVPEEVTDTL